MPDAQRRRAGRRHPAGRLRRVAALDALTMTGHKLGGPPGAGALLLRRDVACVPLLHGGGQERDVRSGTLDVPGVVGLAAATALAVERRGEVAARIAALRDDLVGGVLAAVPDARQRQRPPHAPAARHRQPHASPAARATPC